MSRAGNRPDLVVFEARVRTTNAHGQVVETWTTGFTDYADAERRSETNATFTILYRAGIYPGSHRITYDSCWWTIVSATHDKKRSVLVIDCDFSDKVEVTHLSSPDMEFIDALNLLEPRSE